MPTRDTLGHFRFHVRQSLGKLSRVLRPKPWPQGPDLRLHLGCGAIDHAGFVNVDGIDRPHVHLVQSITDLSRFKSGSVAFIYSSHTLEHFARGETTQILREWRRTLKTGGRLCLSVPDFARIVEMYRAAGDDADFILPPLFGGQDYPFNFHFTTFDERSLTKALCDAGFASVNRWQHGADCWHNLPDWSGRKLQVNGQQIPISLNLEAVR